MTIIKMYKRNYVVPVPITENQNQNQTKTQNQTENKNKEENNTNIKIKSNEPNNLIPITSKKRFLIHKKYKI